MDIFVRFLSPGIMIVLGLGVGVAVIRRYRVPWGLYGAGALTFIGSQVLHIPFNSLVLNNLLAHFGLVIASVRSGWQLLLVGLAYGLSAGLFEELARYVVYGWWLKTSRTWRAALGFGAGHGGIEAVLLGGLGIYSVFQIMSLRFVDLSAVVPPGQLELARLQIETFWSAPWYLVMLGALERVFAICFHLSASVLVVQAFRRRNLLWLLAAIGWHTLLDATAVYGVQAWGAVWTEASLAVFGGLSLLIIYLLREAPDPRPPGQTGERSQLDLSRVEITPEQIEESRYGSS
jgi:uncharacterized membrane protein YhfC